MVGPCRLELQISGNHPVTESSWRRRFFKTNGMTSYDTNQSASEASLSEVVENGRLVGTRTPDLYRRVKGQLTNTLNNLESDGDRLSTPKYV